MSDDQLEKQIQSKARQLKKIVELSAAYGQNPFTEHLIAEWLGEQKGVWVTKEGKSYKLHEMETSHIQNCIKLIEARDNWRTAFLIPMKKELTRRDSKLGEVVYGNI